MSESKKNMVATVNDPRPLLELAIEKGAGVDQLEKLMDLQERWERKEAAKSFKAAMVDFQNNKPVVIKTERAHNSKYAPLAKIQQAVDPVLSQYGISYRWEQSQDENGGITITCIISHVNGHEERTSLTAPKDSSGSKNAIQSLGSTVSYLKRYTLEGAIGLATDKDDDGGNPKPKDELTPKHKSWKAAKESLKNKSATLDAIKKKYELSEENEKLLTDGK